LGGLGRYDPVEMIASGPGGRGSWALRAPWWPRAVCCRGEVGRRGVRSSSGSGAACCSRSGRSGRGRVLRAPWWPRAECCRGEVGRRGWGRGRARARRAARGRARDRRV